MRWKERPGELSFIPPDGKFVLVGYEVNLLPSPLDLKSWSNTHLQIPASLEISKSIGSTGSDFEINLLLSPPTAAIPSSNLSSRPGLGSAHGSGRSTPVCSSGAATSAAPTLQDVHVTIPVPSEVRSVTDLRASRGEAYFTPAESLVEWRIPTKDAAAAGSATLRCTVIGPLSEEDDEEATNGLRFEASNGEYDEYETYQGSASESTKGNPSKNERPQQDQRDLKKAELNKVYMPRSASVSFSVKGWLASGIRVDGLVVDTRKSRGLGEGVKPYKGVKYLTVSKKGVETRC